MTYSSPLLDMIDDGTADLICRSDIYLADEVIRKHSSAGEIINANITPNRMSAS